jgi:outer membrane protein assembly factor BamB
MSKSFSRVFWLGLVCGPLAAAAVRGDWPEFRGPTGQGSSDVRGLPLTWSDTDNVAWKVPIDGLGWSSPVVVGGRIYLTTAIERAKQEFSLGAACFDASTGARLWQVEVFPQSGDVEMHKKNSHASPTPVVEGDRLYVHFGPHGTACLATADGATIWKTKLDYHPQHGNGGSPALCDDLLILCCDGTDQQFVTALDKQTGEPRWRTDRNLQPSKGFSFCTPLVIEVNGRKQAICPGTGAVSAFDPATGKELWRVMYGDGYSVIPRPLYAHGLVYVCTGYNRPRLLAIDPTGDGDVTSTHVRWETDRGAPHTPSPVIVGNEIYFVSDKGIAMCMDALTGEERWQQRIGGNFSASVLAADGRVYLQDENGVAYVVAASPEYQLLATNAWSPEKRTYASYAVEGKALIVRNEAELLRLEIR